MLNGSVNESAAIPQSCRTFGGLLKDMVMSKEMTDWISASAELALLIDELDLEVTEIINN